MSTVLEHMKGVRHYFIQHWDEARMWGAGYRFSTTSCLYDYANHQPGFSGRELTQLLHQELGLPPVTPDQPLVTPDQPLGLTWFFPHLFDEEGGRERILQALERIIAKLEEHEVAAAAPTEPAPAVERELAVAAA